MPTASERSQTEEQELPRWEWRMMELLDAGPLSIWYVLPQHEEVFLVF